MDSKADPAGVRTLSVGNEDVKIMDDGSLIEHTPTGDKVISASLAIDPVAEKKLLWKFDSRILPTLAVMYLL
jgi:hypothetical protein